MTLLMITRKVDKADSNAGFIYNWVKKIGDSTEKLIIICQEQGDTSGLPKNIQIYSLGKEKGYSKLRQLLRFELLIFKNIKKADGVFSHMMPIYSIIVGPFCKLFHKRLIQWYTHKSVDLKLKLASFFIDEFITASKKSFRLKTKKSVFITGHGIDLDIFKPTSKETNQQSPTTDYQIISIGRISPSKDYESIIKAVYDLRGQGVNNVKLKIIGGPGLISQQNYFDILKQMVEKMELKNQVEFLGAIPNNQTIKYFHEADLFINLSKTGGLDKTVLEAMACGTLVLTSNETFDKILPEELKTPKDNPKILAQKIKKIMNFQNEKKEELRKKLRQEVVKNHNLNNLVGKIINQFN